MEVQHGNSLGQVPSHRLHIYIFTYSLAFPRQSPKGQEDPRGDCCARALVYFFFFLHITMNIVPKIHNETLVTLRTPARTKWI